MTSLQIGRVIIFIYFVTHATVSVGGQDAKIPNVKIQAFKPKGFKASIQDNPSISLFVLQANINKPIWNTGIGDISGEILEPKDGWWVVEESNLELKVGDVINYYIFVSIDKTGYLKDNMSYTITELEVAENLKCRPTPTRIRGGKACGGEIIFEDNFNSLYENTWQIEQYIPIYHAEYPFVSYQRVMDAPTVNIVNGHLSITPRLQQDIPGFSNDSIFSGSLNLFSGCTAAAEACIINANGANIVPPIVSGRVTSKSFAFTYGTVTIRAKFPQGDWLYPEILLEPFLKKYGGSRYASGVLKIATARGNRDLYDRSVDYGNKVLYGGPIMDYQCRDTLISKKVLTNGRGWGDDYHIYSVRWAPDRITLTVDGEEWGRVDPAASGLASRFPRECRQLPRALLALGSRIAPFDEYFYITFGVAAGGITEFPDGSYTGNRPKPWSNMGNKAMFYFWQDTSAWLQTWNEPKLLVDYVKVEAL